MEIYGNVEDEAVEDLLVRAHRARQHSAAVLDALPQSPNRLQLRHQPLVLVCILLRPLFVFFGEKKKVVQCSVFFSSRRVRGGEEVGDGSREDRRTVCSETEKEKRSDARARVP